MEQRLEVMAMGKERNEEASAKAVIIVKNKERERKNG